MISRSLSELCTITMGQAPPSGSYNSDGIGLPLLAGASDFGNQTPRASRSTSSPTQVSRRGDILLCVRATIGDLNWSDREYCLGRGIASLRPDPATLDSHFLWHWLRAARARLIRAARGSTFKQITRRDIEELDLTLPPLAEQRRIAAIFDKAHTIHQRRSASLHSLDAFLQSAFFQFFGDPVNNHRGWPQSRLCELASVERGKFTPRPRNDPRYYGGAYPFVQTGDIARSDGTLRQWQQTLNDAGANVSRLFPQGTIAMAIAANIGDTAIVNFDFYCPDSVVGIEADPARVDVGYLEYCLRFFKKRLQAAAPKTAQRNINLQTVRPLLIPLPPRELQVRFGSLRERMAQLRQRYNRELLELSNLQSSLSQDL